MRHLHDTPQPSKPEHDEMTKQLIRTMASLHMENLYAPVDYDALQKPTATVTARNGIFFIQKTPIALFITQKIAFAEGKTLDHLDDMEPGVILLVDKIPLKYLVQSLTYYQDVYKKDQTEAATLMFWNHNDITLPTHYPDNPSEKIEGLVEDGKLIIYCPKQINEGARTNFGHDTFVDWLRKHTTRYVELHSHHTMNAFWSHTDDTNENATQFYFVWGKIFDEQPDLRFRFVSGKDNKIDIPADIVFDFEQSSTPFERVEYPSVWIEKQHTARAYSGPVDFLDEWLQRRQDTFSEESLVNRHSFSKDKDLAQKKHGGDRVSDTYASWSPETPILTLLSWGAEDNEQVTKQEVDALCRSIFAIDVMYKGEHPPLRVVTPKELGPSDNVQAEALSLLYAFSHQEPDIFEAIDQLRNMSDDEYVMYV